MKALTIIMFAILFLVIVFLVPFIIMWLWNGMLPDMFGFPEIGYWRAWGLTILGHLLFAPTGYKFKNSD